MTEKEFIGIMRAADEAFAATDDTFKKADGVFDRVDRTRSRADTTHMNDYQLYTYMKYGLYSSGVMANYNRYIDTIVDKILPDWLAKLIASVMVSFFVVIVPFLPLAMIHSHYQEKIDNIVISKGVPEEEYLKLKEMHVTLLLNTEELLRRNDRLEREAVKVYGIANRMTTAMETLLTLIQENDNPELLEELRNANRDTELLE